MDKKNEYSFEQLMANPPWASAEEVRSTLQKMSMEHERLSMRAAYIEQAIKESNERGTKQAEQMEQLLALVSEIKTNMKVANVLGKLAMWLVGLMIPILGYVWVRNHGG